MIIKCSHCLQDYDSNYNKISGYVSITKCPHCGTANM